jgi:hypothetical protein
VVRPGVAAVEAAAVDGNLCNRGQPRFLDSGSLEIAPCISSISAVHGGHGAGMTKNNREKAGCGSWPLKLALFK